ncbi:MAG: aminotransferase class V-fold PLP-dependent enzyme [Actinobacteria bacterium]|nr:aminotransferase class V-fold PLP-dependent enzyme [Actinomycetota bacterium]MSY70561.1 aminotransferase class V-fold PLP-dependent enzyme [Actinomycetota bacterium]
MARHYLDHASTSPVRSSARVAMQFSLEHHLGDPGRIHAEGMTTRAAIEAARDEVGALFGARSREVVFTSGATEAIAMAAWGAAERGPNQVFAAVEHSAVRRAAEQHGQVTIIGVDSHGCIDVAELLSAVRPDTALVHVQWANHEVGTVQPVQEIVDACRARGVLVHVDAASAAGHLPIDFGALGADFVSIGAHKLGGPPGVGALLVRRGVRVRPLMLGGDQERARRAGIENTPAITGFGAACAELTLDDTLAVEAARARTQIERLASAALTIPGVRRYGHPIQRVPHILCLGLDDIEPQAVLLDLDRRGIAVHSGSACASEGIEPSPVLEAMGADAHRSLRVSVGWSTTDADIDVFTDALPKAIAKLRAYRPTEPPTSR